MKNKFAAKIMKKPFQNLNSTKFAENYLTDAYKMLNLSSAID